MDGQIEKFTVEFFKNLKCDISREFAPKGVPPAQKASADADKGGNILVVKNVPRSFEDLFGKVSPYFLNFDKETSDAIFVGKGSSFFVAMTKYLEDSGKTTLLKIDFEVDPMEEIGKVLSLKNCEVKNVVKKHKNNFFSRFTFSTTFRYLNEAEQVVNEIYVYNGEVVDGDLSGYTVLEGESDKISVKNVEGDYKIAMGTLKDLLKDKTSEISEALGKKADEELARIKGHYDNQMGELGGDLNDVLRKAREVELALRSAEGDEKDVLRIRLERLKRTIVKVGNDDSREKILKEQDFTIKDAMHKHSLNIDNKLVNTTVIYYPVFSFNLFLEGDSSGRYVEMTYDPLTRDLNKLKCESCDRVIDRLSLCSSGHITCDDCLDKCGECGKTFCGKCLKRSCSACGKLLCKSCAVMCLGCGKHVCKNHLREDCVSGDDRCVRCLRACMRCHGMAQEKHFGEALDGSKVCQKCLGSEKRGKVMDEIFKE